MSENKTIPVEVMEKIEEKFPLDDKLNLSATPQYDKRRAAIFGYHLKDELVEFLTGIISNNTKTILNLEAKLQQKDKELEELRDDYNIQNYKYAECVAGNVAKDQQIKELEAKLEESEKSDRIAESQLIIAEERIKELEEIGNKPASANLPYEK